MDEKLVKIIDAQRQLASRPVALWRLLKLSIKNNKETGFEIDLSPSNLGKAGSMMMPNVINELSDKELTRAGFKGKNLWFLDNFDETGIRKMYEDELKNYITHIKQYSLANQIDTFKRYLGGKMKKFGKRDLLFDHEDPFEEWKVCNPFFALLYLEEQDFLKINQIREVEMGTARHPHLDPNPTLQFFSYTFVIKVGGYLIRGNDYIVDIKECVVKFDDGEERRFKNESEDYRLFDLLIQKWGKSVSHKEVADYVKRDGVTLKGKEELGNYVKALLSRVRKRTLETSYGNTSDIVKNENGFLHLRGIEG